MKKAFKYIALSTLLCGLVALAVCYIAIPDRTKSAVDIVVDYLNKPLFIACGYTITLGIVAFIIIKYAFKVSRNKIKEQLAEVKKHNTDSVAKAKEYYEKGVQQKEEIKELIASYDSKLGALTEQLIKVCETSPNVKIKAIAEEIKSKQQQLEEQKQEILSHIDTDLTEYIGGKSKVEELEDKIKELTEKLEKVVEEYGKGLDGNTKEE